MKSTIHTDTVNVDGSLKRVNLTVILLGCLKAGETDSMRSAKAWPVSAVSWKHFGFHRLSRRPDQSEGLPVNPPTRLLGLLAHVTQHNQNLLPVCHEAGHLTWHRLLTDGGRATRTTLAALLKWHDVSSLSTQCLPNDRGPGSGWRIIGRASGTLFPIPVEGPFDLSQPDVVWKNRRAKETSWNESCAGGHRLSEPPSRFLSSCVSFLVLFEY